MKWISTSLFLGQKLEMELKGFFNVVIAMTTTAVVIELQQVSTYTDTHMGPQHESGSVYFRAGSFARCMICSQISHVLIQFTLQFFTFKFQKNLI